MSNIPVVILCGGQGTRMGNTLTKKELVDIGGRPLLWHVMRIFSAYGHNRFILTLGHHADQVRRYFLEYDAMVRDVTLHLAQTDSDDGRARFNFEGEYDHPPWDVTLVDTGLETGRAARLHKVAEYLGNERFFVAYGEAVADINLDDLLVFHENHGKLATMTGVRFHSQYGMVEADDDGRINTFAEKPLLPYWVNGGFMLYETQMLDIIQENYRDDLFEKDIMPALMTDGELMLYRHTGYWQSMKTLQDYITLKDAWQRERPWQVW